jgi:hydroxypyruvate reductase
MAADDLKRQAVRIFKKAVEAVDPEKAVLGHVKRVGDSLLVDGRPWDLGAYDRILVVGAGKAGAPMAKALEGLLGDRIAAGAVVVKDGHGIPLDRIRLFEASHPIPDARGVRGAQAVAALARDANSMDLVVCLLSGGGSALLTAPAEGVTLEDKQAVTQVLLACGATIHEVNAVRKHLSGIKGGRLAALAHPAAVVSLILSDVIGDDLDIIASGPTVPDTSSFGDAVKVLKGYGVWDRIPAASRAHLEKGLAGDVPETPKPGDPSFGKDCWALVGTNFQALKAAAREAESLGYRPVILSSMMRGEARDVARAVAAIAKEAVRSGNPMPPPACILSGGETTVTIKGGGRGGRNQEFALAAAMDLEGLQGMAVLCAGTDGTDGPTDAAGAVADGATVSRARALGLDPWTHLDQNDAYPLFEALGDLVMTGPTRTNVMDVYMVLIGEAIG